MPSHVEDHDVGMEMRVEFARGMFSEARIEQLACRFMPNIAVHTSAKRGMLFDPADGGADCPLMRGDDPFIARPQRPDRYRFRDVDRKLPPRLTLDTALAAAPGLLLTYLAGEQRLGRPSVGRSRERAPPRNFPHTPRAFSP